MILSYRLLPGSKFCVCLHWFTSYQSRDIRINTLVALPIRKLRQAYLMASPENKALRSSIFANIGKIASNIVPMLVIPGLGIQWILVDILINVEVMTFMDC